MSKKLQNSKDYAESPEFLPALGSPSLQLEVNLIPSSRYYKKKLYTNIYSYSYIPYLPEYKSYPSISRTLYFSGEKFDQFLTVYKSRY